jgi:hypothetical protein|tara:strand:- start:592 stop:1281 length:690 start_codon:yes stop_codon:yes gene_type:complete
MINDINLIYLILLIILIILFIVLNYKRYEEFLDLFDTKFLNSIKFTEIKISSPYNTVFKKKIYNGRFKLYLNKDKDIVYKKVSYKEFLEDHNITIESYKSKIYNLKNLKIINKYLYEPNYIYIKDDGSYYSKYIKNNIRIYDILEKNKQIDKEILNKIIYKIKELKNDLIIYKKNNKLFGDWNTSNLVYNIDDNKIYNIDYEGFALYNIAQDGSDLYFDKIIEKLTKKL